MKMIKKVSLTVLGAMCCLQFGGVAMAEEDKPAVDKPTANLAVAALSKYVWRGFEVTKNSMVLEPSMTVAYKGFSVNVWGNLDTDYYGSGPNSGTNFWNETDLTLAYDWTMGPVGMTAGYIYYAFDGLPDTQEVFARAALHVLLTPTLSIYRDYQNLAGWYMTLGVSHVIPITEKIGVNLGAQVGYLDSADASSYAEVNASNWTYTDKSFNGFHDGLLSVSVPIPVNEYITITPVLNYSFPLSGKAADLIEIRSLNGGGSGDNNFIYGGVTLSLAF
jgi:hypothetical protein